MNYTRNMMNEYGGVTKRVCERDYNSKRVEYPSRIGKRKTCMFIDLERNKMKQKKSKNSHVFRCD